MDFEYVGNGTITICGKAISSYEFVIITTYNARDIVYVKEKAKRGIIEKICIKTVYFSDPGHYPYYGVNSYPIYKDTFNALWLERDLVDEATALSLIETYIQRIGAELLAIECS